jgi:hypothetical protein
MLKLEPTEAENVVVAAPRVGAGALAGLADELDALVRGGNEATARARADSAILQGELGLSTGDCDLLRLGAELLRGRRYSR